MTNTDKGWRLRLAVLAMLVKNAPKSPGRTALMKFAYLLQTVRGVPLGYDFELYTYGPYDVSVLSDLSQAITFEAIKSQTVYFSSGYGYEYSANESGLADVCKDAGEDLEKVLADIEWVLDEFGSDTASRLELVSTVIFAEREMRRKRQTPAKDVLCKAVKGIKPYFTEDVIEQTIDELSGKQLVSVV